MKLRYLAVLTLAFVLITAVPVFAAISISSPADGATYTYSSGLNMSVSFSVSAGYSNPKEHITDEFLQKARNLINSYVGYGNVLNAYNGLKDMGYEFSDIDDFAVLWNMLGSVRVLPATDAELRALFNSMSDANLNNWLDYVGVGLFGGGSTRGGGGGFSSKDAETLNLNDIIEQYKPIFTIPASDARVVSLSQYINLVDNVFGISSLKSTKTTLASLVRGREFGDVTYATYFDYTTYYPQVTYNPNYHYYLATITSDKLYASDKNGLSVVGVMTGYTPSYAGLGILNKYEYTLTKAGSNVYQVFTSSFDNSNKAVQTVSSIGTSLLVNHNLSFAIYDDTAYSKEIDYNFSTEITNNFNNITNNYYDFFYSAQDYETVDKNFRRLTSKVVTCRTRFGRLTHCRHYLREQYEQLINTTNIDRKYKMHPISSRYFVQSDELRDKYDSFKMLDSAKNKQYMDRVIE